MRAGNRAIVLDGASVMRMASAGIIDLWNEGGVLWGRDVDGAVFSWPEWSRRGDERAA